MSWFDEFRGEILHDHRQIIEARQRRQGGPWVFERAAEAVRTFYRERISGYASCGSVTTEECDSLLRLVDALGCDDFPLR